MRRALQLARRGWGQVAPNPLVGAVVVRDGRVVGEGWHAVFGGPHAEVMALQAAGDAARGATLYVSLEPCAHHGKTPPCTDAILRAGVARVVVGTGDPHPVAAGGGELLRTRGIDVVMGVEAADAAELNAPFLFAARQAAVGASPRPWVTLKLATSVDGAIADYSRTQGWLTGPAARRAVHRLRASADAIAVGIGTALADDPALTVRDVPAPRTAPMRVVFDREARLPLAGRLATTAREVPVLLVVAPEAVSRDEAQRRRQLAAAGVTLLPAHSHEEALVLLADRGVRHLLVEGGASLASQLVTGSLVHRLVIFEGSVILGHGALPAFDPLPGRRAGDAPRMRRVTSRAFGDDVMTVYAVSEL